MSSCAGSLDANVVLRLLLNDVPQQHEAVVKLLYSTSQAFAVSDTAIIEVVFVLCRGYDFTRSQTAEAIEGLMRLKELKLNRSLFERAMPLFIKHPGLSFEDCCLASYAELSEAKPLWTFDKKLAAQASSAQLMPV